METHPPHPTMCKECLKWLLKKRRCYDLKYKMDAVEFAKMNSNEKADKNLTYVMVSKHVCK